MPSEYLSTRSDHGGIHMTLNIPRLDASNADAVKAAMQQSVDGADSTLTVDLAALDFVDSSGLGALVSVRKRLPREKEMRLVNVDNRIRTLFELTRMDRVFSIR